MIKWPRITYLGQSGFHIEFRSKNLLIDPSDRTSGLVPGDVVYATHKHIDHTRGIGSFLERNPNAVLVGNKQVLGTLDKWGDRSIEAVLGQQQNFDDFSLEFVEGTHGLFRGTVNYGVVVRTDKFSFGHCGDSTRLDGFQNKQLDVLAIPISGLVSTSPKSAVSQLADFTESLPAVVPMHWLFRKPTSFCRMFQEHFPEGNCIIPKFGEPLKQP